MKLSTFAHAALRQNDKHEVQRPAVSFHSVCVCHDGEMLDLADLALKSAAKVVFLGLFIAWSLTLGRKTAETGFHKGCLWDQPCMAKGRFPLSEQRGGAGKSCGSDETQPQRLVAEPSI